MWWSSGSPHQFLTFDLGKTVILSKVYIWPWSFSSFWEGNIKDAKVWVSSEADINTASNFNAVASITILAGTNNPAGNTNAQAFDAVGTGVRLVRIKSLGNWGSGIALCLAEARFESGNATGNMPWVVLNSPHEGDEFGYATNTAGADITVDATITDPDGASDIQMVQVFDGTNLAASLTSAPYSVVLHGITSGYHMIRVKATDKSGLTAWNEARVFVRQMYGDSVIKIDDTQDMGTGVNQIWYWIAADPSPVELEWGQGKPQDYPADPSTDPRYHHSDHYSGTANDFYEVRFKGIKIDVFATVAAHHGNGYASIDGGPETPVSYWFNGRDEQAFVYGSPILTNGVHALHVRVAGGGVVTADRFDVQVFDLVATQLAKADNTVTIDLRTPNPDGQYQVLESSTLATWSPVPGANVSIIKTGDHTIRATITGVSSNTDFFRVVLQ